MIRRHNVAVKYPERVKELSQELFAYLNRVGARYPEKDPEYKAELERQHLEKIRNELWPRVEQQRLDFLSKDFDPGNKWWGSMVTED